MKPLDLAISRVNGVGKLAELIGVGQSVISNWRARNSIIDPLLCSEIERVTDGAVTRQMLRPDDWQTIWPELTRPDAVKAAIRAEDLQAVEEATAKRNGGVRKSGDAKQRDNIAT